MSEPFLGEIRIFPYNFAPRSWAFCNGQILSIAQNTALFSLLGTTYGGNGTTTFALPDLRGRVAISSGQGPGLSNYDLGQVGGTESVTLTQNQMPGHSHLASVNNGAATTTRPNNQVPAQSTPAYAAAGDGSTFNPAFIQNTGGGQPHGNVQPFLTLNFCIALEGIFPSRN
jgi:microcystin-dependent protein